MIETNQDPMTRHLISIFNQWAEKETTQRKNINIGAWKWG
jgi:hypothetical protein